MSGSRVSFYVCLVSLSLFSVPALAADPDSPGPATSAPRGLTPPPVEEDPTPPPAPANPTPTTSAPNSLPNGTTGTWDSPDEQVLPDKPGAPSSPKVTVRGLAAIDPSGVGLLNEGNGGLPSSMWDRSDRQSIAVRLSQLPSATSSPAMQSLTRRLLLTAAQPPAGTTPAGEPTILGWRAMKLVANGWTDDAAKLAAQSPRDDSYARQAWVEALMLQGRETDACGDAGALRLTANDPYWLKLRAYCFIQQKNVDGAQMTLDIMRERQVEDPQFFTLAEAAMNGGKASIAELPSPTGLHLALIRQANVVPPVSVAAWAPAALLMARDATDPNTALTAGERAALSGALAVEDLRMLYQAETFTADQIDDPEEAATKLSPARANALFYQSILKRTVPAARATAFVAAMQRAESQNRFPLFARVIAPIALQVQPGPDTAWLAPHIARVLIYSNNDKAVDRWFAVLGSPTDGPSVNALQMQLGLAKPTVENMARMTGAMSWLGQNALAAGPSKDWLMDRATREIPLADALGFIIPPDAQWAVSATTAGAVPSGVSSEALIALPHSAQEGKVGETVLNALVAIGPGGPARAQGQTIARVVKALNAVGLRDEARAIAVEAILTAPIRARK